MSASTATSSLASEASDAAKPKQAPKEMSHIEAEILFTLTTATINGLVEKYLLGCIQRTHKLAHTPRLSSENTPAGGKPAPGETSLRVLAKKYPDDPHVIILNDILRTQAHIVMNSPELVKQFCNTLQPNAQNSEDVNAADVTIATMMQLWQRTMSHSWSDATKDMSWADIGATLIEFWASGSTNASLTPMPYVLASWYTGICATVVACIDSLADPGSSVSGDNTKLCATAIVAGSQLLPILRQALLPYSLTVCSKFDPTAFSTTPRDSKCIEIAKITMQTAPLCYNDVFLLAYMHTHYPFCPLFSSNADLRTGAIDVHDLNVSVTDYETKLQARCLALLEKQQSKVVSEPSPPAPFEFVGNDTSN